MRRFRIPRGVNLIEDSAFGGWRLAPAAADPHVAVAVLRPMTAHPDGGGPGPSHPAATNPYPAAIPSPIARCPDVIGRRSDRNHLDARRRRGNRCHDNCLRGWRGWRLCQRRSRGCRRSRPVCGRGCRRGRSRRLGWGRLDLVSHRRRIRLLHHVGRLNVVNRHVSDLPLRTSGEQSRDTPQRHARGPHISVDRIKVFHIQPIGR
jgi:hypothetical protein